jgi:hypothetical protein
MELSYSHRFIFIHVYRAAGQSISKALEPYSFVPRRSPLTRVPVVRRLTKRQLYTLRWHNHGHIKARELKAALPPKTFETFFKFAFVRNPWDWQVSIYHYVLQRPDHPDHKFFSKSFPTFDDYLDWRVHSKGAELQTDYLLSESGELLVDFVGRFETLAEDYDTVCKRVGIDNHLPHINASRHRHFSHYYTPETRALVEEVYRPDIDLFGYEFDAVSSPESSGLAGT